jgi:hypothetical protein
MHPFNSQITCVSAAPGLYRLYHQSPRVGEAVTVDYDAFHVSHLFTATGRVVASLRDAANWLDNIERAVAAPLARHRLTGTTTSA